MGVLGGPKEGEKRSPKKKRKKKSKGTSYLPGGPPAVPLIEPLIPLLLAKSALSFLMYPKVKAPFLRHLAIPGFPLSDHTVSKSVQYVQCEEQHEV